MSTRYEEMGERGEGLPVDHFVFRGSSGIFVFRVFPDSPIVLTRSRVSWGVGGLAVAFAEAEMRFEIKTDSTIFPAKDIFEGFELGSQVQFSR